MVSRQTTRPLRKLVPAVAIGFSALLGIVGCSAGQVAQTAEMEPAVNGNSAQAGDIALRDVMVAYPDGEAYKAGDDAPLLLTIINTGNQDDELVGVTSPAGQVEPIGNPKIPGRSALKVVLPDDNPAASESSSASTTETTEAPDTETSGTSGTETTGSETSGATTTTGDVEIPENNVPPVVGTMSLVIRDLTGALPFGKNVPVTFVFASGAKVTVQLPIAAPSTPRAEATPEDESH